MATETPGVKHIEMICLGGPGPEPCKVSAFVQVIVVADDKLQKKIDGLAHKKLVAALSKGHKDGQHG